MSADLIVSSSLTIPAAELSFSAVRASGPGGQNVNKVATKVELRFELAESAVLPPAVKARLASLARSRIDAHGRLVVACDATRSQSRNLELARAKLCELLRAALIVPKRRRATKPSSSARRKRVENKRLAGDKKRARGKVDID